MIIKRMSWASPDRTSVFLIADTEEGENLNISTPYNDTSIIWEYVKAYPGENIEAYVPPAPVEDIPKLTTEEYAVILSSLESKIPGLTEFIKNSVA